MKLESISFTHPSREMTNDDVIDVIRENSGDFTGNFEEAVTKILLLYKYSGAKKRYWLGNEETPIGLVKNAVDEALEEANLHKNEIDLIIYASVDRGYLEPGSSYRIAQAAGMEGVRCYDILDACMGWSTALENAYHRLQTDDYKHVMIVNVEFGVTREGGPGYPRGFRLKNLEELEWAFPGWTIGEAATVTILSDKDPDNEWEFHFSSRTDLSDLCTVTLPGYEGYSVRSDHEPKGPNLFTSLGYELHKQGGPEVIRIFKRLKTPREDISIIVPHASSQREWHNFAKDVGIEHLLYNEIYPWYGNLVSASVPAGIRSAIDDKLIKRGDTIVCWVGSAGMSFSVCSFKY